MVRYAYDFRDGGRQPGGFFHAVGLDHVPCPPGRVPVACPEAGRAAPAGVGPGDSG
ncbi:hypothetical protein [Streptomyces eurythermus]